MYLIMGPAGAGKSVQGQMLVDSLGLEWVSTGAVLRAAMEDPEIRKKMEHGELLDDSTVEEIVAKALKASDDSTKIILDGFPRDHHQARWLVGFCRGGDMTVEGVIHLTIDETVAKERLMARGRTDDNEEAIARRFHEYQQVTKPILEYYQQQGYEISDINGDQSIDGVHSDIMKALGK